MNFNSSLSVILHHDAGSPRCVGWHADWLRESVHIVVRAVDAASEADAARLASALRSAVSRILGGTAETPCGGNTASSGCHARRVPCRRLLVELGSSSVSAPYPASWHRFPAIRRGSPAPLGGSTRYEEYDSPEALVPDVLARAGIAASRPNVFLSYRREDGRSYVEQLFQALSLAGISVSLDVAAIRAGDDIREKVRARLASSELVLVLATRGLALSSWCWHEVAYARAHELGVVTLSLPGIPVPPYLQSTQRLALDRADLKVERRRTSFRKGALTRIVEHVKRASLEAHARRRKIRLQSIRSSLLFHGISPQLAGGVVLGRTPAGNLHRAVPSDRLPGTVDFRMAQSLGVKSSAVVGPVLACDAGTRSDLRWLGDETNVTLVDRSRSLSWARSLK